MGTFNERILSGNEDDDSDRLQTLTPLFFHVYPVNVHVVPLIIPKKNFRLEKLEGLISYLLFIFNSKNVEKGK